MYYSTGGAHAPHYMPNEWAHNEKRWQTWLATSDLTIPLMAQDALAPVDALGIKDFNLMGWSMGGEIAQQVTVDTPSHVPKLVLCAPRRRPKRETPERTGPK